jgi:hypothetical protein
MERPSLGAEIEWAGDAAVVVDVEPNGVAAAGIKAGDSIVGIGGMVPDQWLRDAPRVGRVGVVLLRDGARIELDLGFPPSKSEPENAPEQSEAPPPSWAERVLSQELASFFGAIEDNLKRIRASIAQLEATGLSVITDLRKARFEAEHLNKGALLRVLHGLDRSVELFAQGCDLVCNGVLAPQEDIETLTGIARSLLGAIHAVTCVLKAAQPQPAPRRHTELVGFADRSDVPMMGSMNVIPTGPRRLAGPLTKQVGTTPPYWSEPPMTGPMRWTTEDGRPISWHEQPECPEVPEKPRPPRPREEVDDEIARLEDLLAKTQHPRQRAWMEERLDGLRCEALGIPPPPKPADRRRSEPDSRFGRQLDEAGQMRLYWKIVSTYPGAVTYTDVPTAWDEKGNPTAYRTVERVDSEVHKIARQGVQESMTARDPSLRWEATYGGIEAALKAEERRTGIPWNHADTFAGSVRAALGTRLGSSQPG